MLIFIYTITLFALFALLNVLSDFFFALLDGAEEFTPAQEQQPVCIDS